MTPKKDLDRFLTDTKGVIHVGASIGQERNIYQQFNLPVIWIEPIPEIFAQLKRHLRCFPKQKAFQYLVTDKDNATYKFYITNNRGESSSIFKFKMHKQLWDWIEQIEEITLQSITLNSLIKKENIDVSQYNALVLDTQGSELLILKGVDLDPFKYIKVEVPNFESYEGGCQEQELNSFLKSQGYKKIACRSYVSYVNGVRTTGFRKGNNYYDFVYKRKNENI